MSTTAQATAAVLRTMLAARASRVASIVWPTVRVAEIPAKAVTCSSSMRKASTRSVTSRMTAQITSLPS
jgi:hypothetical protein